MRKRYFWSKMYEDIKRWVSACVKCAEVKPPQSKNHELLEPVLTSYPFEMLAIDILGPFKISSDGFSYVRVCIDLFTSYVELGALKTITAEEVAETIFDLIITRHGCPTKILTDQGRQFISKLYSSMCVKPNVKKYRLAHCTLNRMVKLSALCIFLLTH